MSAFIVEQKEEWMKKNHLSVWDEYNNEMGELTQPDQSLSQIVTQIDDVVRAGGTRAAIENDDTEDELSFSLDLNDDVFSDDTIFSDDVFASLQNPQKKEKKEKFTYISPFNGGD